MPAAATPPPALPCGRRGRIGSGVCLARGERSAGDAVDADAVARSGRQLAHRRQESVSSLATASTGGLVAPAIDSLLLSHHRERDTPSARSRPATFPRDGVQRVQVVSIVARAFTTAPDLRPTGFWDRLAANGAQYTNVSTRWDAALRPDDLPRQRGRDPRPDERYDLREPGEGEHPALRHPGALPGVQRPVRHRPRPVGRADSAR